MRSQPKAILAQALVVVSALVALDACGGGGGGNGSQCPGNPNCPSTLTATSITPNTGSVAGGTNATIRGTGFAAGATVAFSGTSATSVTFVSTTQLTAVTPARSAGPATVVVTSGGATATVPGSFTFVAPTAVIQGPQSFNAGVSVQFSSMGSSAPAPNQLVRYIWDCGQPNYTTGNPACRQDGAVPTPQFVYSRPTGNVQTAYNVTLIVEDSQGTRSAAAIYPVTVGTAYGVQTAQ